ncbi:hypothetical protein [Clostridium tertium]|uniref:hypothetical protein n=1 Tax=Clostridium tertium TaxID=1559 RepID=UPI0022E822A2|nr:hypothetical protein [Clostridium tertium]
MKLELLETNYIRKDAPYYHGTTEQKVYACPCKNGTVVYEYDDIPGSRDWYTIIKCDYCTTKYQIENYLSSNWKIVEKL